MLVGWVCRWCQGSWSLWEFQSSDSAGRFGCNCHRGSNSSVRDHAGEASPAFNQNQDS